MERIIEVGSKEHRSIIWNVPNFITFLRIGAIPVVLVSLFFPSPMGSFLAALFFSIASATDLLDGYVARQLKSETAIGKLLDPLADKLLINSSLIMLIPLGRIPAWIVVVIVAREIAVTGLRGIASLEGVVIAADKWGKRKTVFQSIAIIGLLLHYEYFGIDFHALGMVLLWIALVITVGSGLNYFYKFYQGYSKQS